jgi:hypothetical protein
LKVIDRERGKEGEKSFLSAFRKKKGYHQFLSYLSVYGVLREEKKKRRREDAQRKKRKRKGSCPTNRDTPD